MRLAFDVNVNNAELGRLLRLGFDIVCVARAKEPDEEWIERAIEADAQIIFSDDLDVPNYLDRMGYDDVVHRRMFTSKILVEAVWRTKKNRTGSGYLSSP